VPSSRSPVARRAWSRRPVVAVAVGLAALALSSCSISTTDKPGYQAPNPIDAGPSGPSGASGAASGEKVDLQLRQVLSISDGGPATCPAGTVATPPAQEPATLCSQDRTLVYSLAPAAIDGNRPTSLEVAGSANGPAVRVRYDAQGAASLSTLTLRGSQESPPRSLLAIVSHGRVQAAPTMSGQIEGGILDISGFPSAQAAQSALDFIQSPS
jgi:hypothetical protein